MLCNTFFSRYLRIESTCPGLVYKYFCNDEAGEAAQEILDILFKSHPNMCSEGSLVATQDVYDVYKSLLQEEMEAWKKDKES